MTRFWRRFDNFLNKMRDLFQLFIKPFALWHGLIKPHQTSKGPEITIT
jgi:hypothetical protein